MAIVFIPLLPVHAAEPSFELHMLDVGQGLSVLIRSDDEYLLYDGGGPKASSFVVSYLTQQGIDHLDYIVASHYDDDHLNGVVGALHVFSCGTILAPDYPADTDIYRSYLSAATSNGASIIHPVQGDSYQFGDAQIQVVGPSNYGYPEENNNSIALRILYGSTSYLLCGDAETRAEEDMVDSGEELTSDLYVVNHHGSASSSSLYFLDHVLPEYALISCGQDNAYGHPDIETVERLQSIGCQIFRTDQQGTVVASSDGNSIWFNTEPYTGLDDGSAGVGDPSIPLSVDTSGPVTYVCNINTYKFHYEYCDSVNRMKESNKKYTTESRDALIAQGFEPCQNCNP